MIHYELNLRDYLRIILKRKFVIVSSAIIFSIASFIYSKMEVPIFESSATVKFMERRSVGGMLADLVDYSPGDMMETQANVVKGSGVLKRTGALIGEISKDDPARKVDSVILRFQREIIVKRIGYTNIIKITVRNQDPHYAVRLANAVAEAYMEENRLEKNLEARTVRKFIEEQLKSARKRMFAAEERLKIISEESKNIAIAEEVKTKLNDLEFSLAAMLQKYTEKHPKVIQTRDQIIELNRQLAGFAGKEVDYTQIKREVEVSQNIYSTLREKLEEVRIAEAEKVSDISIVDSALMPMEAINSKSPLNTLLGAFLGLIVGMLLAFFTETLDTSMGTIEDVEATTKIIVLGVIPSVSINKPGPKGYLQQLADKIKPPDLNFDERRKVALFSHYNPMSPVTEAFRHIKTNLKLSPELKTILVTSAGPKEGKTSIITNLALVCAQEGLKTLLVSSDLRKPYISEYFGISNKQGLSDVILGSVSLEDAIRGFSDMVLGDISIEDAVKHPGLAHISILPAGTPMANPAEILNSGEFGNILKKMKEMYDIVLFDSPPVLPVADASVLSKKLDGVVLCYEIGRTSRHALLRMKTQLEVVNANFIGIVLNNISTSSGIIEVYPYYRKYTKEYNHENPDDFRKKK